MVVCVVLSRDKVDSSMYRNEMRPGTSVTVMAAKPPKPPCWRDFVSQSLLAETEFTDISKIARSSNDSYSSDGHTNKTTGKPKRLRARIHRTRSQFTIEESDLPAEALTVTLAETKPDDIGLSRETTFNETIFKEDNNRKCQSWLKGVEACKPLEDISCYDLSGLEGEAVSLEIPDDTQSYKQTDSPHRNKGNNQSVHLNNTRHISYERISSSGSTIIPASLKRCSSSKDDVFINT